MRCSETRTTGNTPRGRATWKLRRDKTRQKDVPSACWARFAAARLVRRAAIVKAVGSPGVTATCFAVSRVLCELAQLGRSVLLPGRCGFGVATRLTDRGRFWRLAFDGWQAGARATLQTQWMGLVMAARTVHVPHISSSLAAGKMLSLPSSISRIGAEYRLRATSLAQLSDMGQCNLYFSSVVGKRPHLEPYQCLFLPGCKKASRHQEMLSKKPTSSQGTETPNSHNLWLAGPNDEAAFRLPSHPNPIEGGSDQKQKGAGSEAAINLSRPCRRRYVSSIDILPRSATDAHLLLRCICAVGNQMVLLQRCCGTLPPFPKL